MKTRSVLDGIKAGALPACFAVSPTFPILNTATLRLVSPNLFFSDDNNKNLG